MGNYDLAVAYRIYPGVSKQPFIFANNKLLLAELGVKSFKHSLNGLKAKVFFLLDNCPDDYQSMILKYFSTEDIEFIRLTGIGNLPSFGKQIDILKSQQYSEFVYFIEDDYLFLPGATEEALNFMKSGGVDFITPYDHIDSYELKIHQQHGYKIKISPRHHWRTAASTCMTFLTKKQVLIKTESVFRSYCKGNWDSSLWFALTNHNVLRPDSFFLLFSNTILFKAVLLSWIKTWRQILFGKKYVLWQPIPSLATHMESTGIAPVIDWDNVVKKYE
jgi:hypothetical protein